MHDPDAPDAAFASPAEPPDLEWLRTFGVFAEHLNFTRAAEALGLSQPAVHGQVRKLAERLGTPLYRKVGRRLELTEAGRATRLFGADVLARSARFVADLQGLEAGPVVLAAGEGSVLYLLGDAIRAFAGRPGSRLRLRLGDATATLDAVRTHQAHIGVAPLVGETAPADVEARPMLAVGQQVVMPADDPLARRGRIGPADLADGALIVAPPDRPHRRAVDRWMGDVPWRVAVEVGGWPLMLHCVATGLGRALVNDVCTPPPGTIARPLERWPGRTWFALRRRSGTRGHGEEALWRTLADTVG